MRGGPNERTHGGSEQLEEEEPLSISIKWEKITCLPPHGGSEIHAVCFLMNEVKLEDEEEGGGGGGGRQEAHTGCED